jgi:hypothetical protein
LGLEKSWKVSLEDTLIDVKIGSALPKFNLCSKGAPKPTLELQSDFSQSLCRAFAKPLSSLCRTFVRPLTAFASLCHAFVKPLSSLCRSLGLEKSWKVSLEDTLIDVKIGSALP